VGRQRPLDHPRLPLSLNWRLRSLRGVLHHPRQCKPAPKHHNNKTTSTPSGVPTWHLAAAAAPAAGGGGQRTRVAATSPEAAPWGALGRGPYPSEWYLCGIYVVALGSEWYLCAIYVVLCGIYFLSGTKPLLGLECITQRAQVSTPGSFHTLSIR
jgi:hypothetical protein